MKRLHNLVGACLSAALLAACGGGNSFSSSTPTSVAPPLAPLLGAPGLSQSVRSQPAFGRSASHRIKKNVQIESQLYSFKGGSDGAQPKINNLTNVGGTLYGTTLRGGSGCESSGYGCGTVFSITPSGTETESVLHSFAGGSDGAYPYGSLLNVGGTLYGTTSGGGACESSGYSCGTVFKITTSGVYAQLYSFAGGSDGADPLAGLTKVGGTLYGTTTDGGANGVGTVFTIKCRGLAGGCTESVLYSFSGYPYDGAHPYGSLINVGGTLYGTTSGGGTSNNGTVFKITTSGAYAQLHSFLGYPYDGWRPFGGLTKMGGRLYGTTEYGGESNGGTVFMITTSGAYALLYSFSGPGYPFDGARPFGSLTDIGGTLYGTTEVGGVSGRGTVFALLKNGMEFVLYNFSGNPYTSGDFPFSNLTNVGGTLYGMTEEGGSSGDGTIFSFSP